LDTKQLLDEVIYPALYEKLPDVLPEFGFILQGDKYVSSTGAKITEEEGKPGKVYVYSNNMTRLIDYTRGDKTIWDYVKDRDGLNQQETLFKLAELAGVSSSELEIDPEMLQRIEEANRKAQLWEDANTFFIQSFHTDQTGERVRKYCEDRGYTLQDVSTDITEGKRVVTDKMELGYIPSIQKLREHLLSKGHDQQLIDSTTGSKALHPQIGGSHKLTIPYRDSVGRIIGLIVRNVDYKSSDKIGKYLYTTNLNKKAHLFNLRGIKDDKDLVVVEGILDAAIATARGIPNVVALGGTALNIAQLNEVIKRGAKKITLCLDSDKAGQKATVEAIDTILSVGMTRLYVAQLPANNIDPDKKVDPDSFIRDNGIDKFKEIIKKAIPYWQYQADHLLQPYTEEFFLEPKELDDLEASIAELAMSIPDLADRIKYLNYLHENNKVAGIYKEAIELKVSELQEVKALEQQKQQIIKSTNRILALVKEGAIPEAKEQFEAGIKQIRIESGKDLLQPYSFANWLNDVKTALPSLKTDIPELDRCIGIPQGAITLIAGRPSHGKTTLMYNLMLNMVRIYPKQSFYFFSYEEEKKYILVKLLNRIIGNDLCKNIEGGRSYLTNYELLKAYMRGEFKQKHEVIEQGLTKLEELIDNQRIVVVDKSYPVEELSSLVSYLHNNNEIGCLFIDYIQRIGINQRTQDKRVEIATISKYILDNIAKATGLPVVMGCQLNRSSTGKEPTLEGLKEAGNLEEDSNLVISIYNESREGAPEGGGAWGNLVPIELKILKNRDGEPNRKITLEMDRYCGIIRSAQINERVDESKF
jgi:DNA primase catalytic core